MQPAASVSRWTLVDRSLHVGKHDASDGDRRLARGVAGSQGRGARGFRRSLEFNLREFSHAAAFVNFRMRIAFIADARSPISNSWIRHFIARGHDVHVISSYRCPALKGAAFYEAPIGPAPVAVARDNRISASSSRS